MERAQRKARYSKKKKDKDEQQADDGIPGKSTVTTGEPATDNSLASSNNVSGKKVRGTNKLPAISGSDSDTSEDEAVLEAKKAARARRRTKQPTRQSVQDVKQGNSDTSVVSKATVSSEGKLPSEFDKSVSSPLQTTQTSPGPNVDASGETKQVRQSNSELVSGALTRPVIDKPELTSNPRYDPASSGPVSCPVCHLTLNSTSDLLAHISLRHAPDDSFNATSSQLQDAERTFITMWANDAMLAIARSSDVTTSSEFLSKSPPRLFFFDEGMSSSFRFMAAVEAQYVPEVKHYAWYDEVYDIELPIPAAAVVRMVLETNWCMVGDDTPPVKVTTVLPTLSNVGLLREVLSTTLSTMKYNPIWARANLVMMATKVVLANVVINLSSAWTQDATPAVANRLLRQVKGRPELWAIMYPRRTMNANVSKISQFVDQTRAERTGRVDRAMMFQGERVVYTDVWETCDTMTVRLREAWTGKIFRMHFNHTDIALALSQCSRVLAFSSVMALSTRTIMPYRATAAERKLTQVLDLARFGDLRLRIEPVLQAAADTLRQLTMLEINPKVLTGVLNRICENQTQSVTIAGTLLNLLSSSNTDSTAFWTTMAGWLYNGLATVTLKQVDYPNPSSSITDYQALWSALIVSLVSPLTNDPNAPAKVFMAVANLFNGIEPIPMNNASMTQSTAAWHFNHPKKWPQCLIHPDRINRQLAPFMRAWADLINQHWPRPGNVQYGAPYHLGVTELLVGDGQIVTPMQVQPPQLDYANLDRDNEMYNWVHQVCGFFVRCVNGTDLRTAANQATQQALVSAISQLRTAPSFTFGYLARYIPYELAMIAPTLAFPPFQVPYQRLNADDIIYQLGVRRHVVRDQIEPANDTSSTIETLGQIVEVDAKALFVSLFAGTIPAEVLPSVHYAERVTPLYMDDDFFSPHQRAVLVSEAYSLVRAIISQISDTRNPQRNPLDWVEAPNASSQVAKEIVSVVNKLFKDTFDLKDEVLEGLIGYGDPRYTQVELVAQKSRGQPLRFEPAIPPSVLTRSLMLVEDVMTAEPNLFGLATGDIYLERMDTAAGFSGLNALGVDQWDEGDPDVFVTGTSLQMASTFNGAEPVMLDRDEIARPLTGRWVITLEAWRSSVVTVQKMILPRIRSGKMAVRLKTTLFMYTIVYYEPAVGIDEWQMLSAWSSSCEPLGIPPVPFSAPKPSEFNVATAQCTRYLRCANFNEGSLMVTNSGAPRTMFGQAVGVDLERWQQLCDLNVGQNQIQLPNLVEFYQTFRRYNIKLADITQAISLTGTLTQPPLAP
nr:core shell [Largemouth bass reovirus]